MQSRNNNGREPEKMSVDSSLDESFDPLLDFGTSVELAEDLRRDIRAEIQLIDASINKATNSVKDEERKEGQLKQDISHAHSEMQNLSRGATDRLEDAGVHSGFLTSLNHTLQLDLVISTGVESSGACSPTSVMEHANSQSVSEGNDELEKPTNKDILKEKEDEQKRLAQSIDEINMHADALFLEKKTKLEEIQRIKESIKSNELESAHRQACDKVEVLQADVKDESRRKKSIIETIQQSRSRSEANAQQVAEKTKQINALRVQNATENEELSQVVSAKASEVALKESDFSDRKSKFTLVSSRVEQCQNEIEAYDLYCRNREARMETLKCEAKEKQKLLSMIEKLTAAKQIVSKELEESSVAVENAEKFELEVAQEKDTNDKLEASMFLPGQKEIGYLLKKKEAMAAKISEQRSEMISAQSKEREVAKDLLGKQKEVSKELASVKEALEASRAKKRQAASVVTEERENLEREISNWNAMTERNKVEYAAREKDAKVIDQCWRESAKEKIEQLKLDARKGKAEMELQLKILERGRELIEKARERAKQLKEKPITL